MQKTEPGTRSDWYKGLGGWVFPRLSDGTSLRKGHWSRPGWCEVWEGEGQGLPGRETSRHKGPKGRTHLQWKNLHVAVGQRARGSDEMKSDLGWGEMGRQGFTSQSRVWTLFWRAWRAHWDCYTGCRESKEAGEDVCIRQEPTTGGGGGGGQHLRKAGVSGFTSGLRWGMWGGERCGWPVLTGAGLGSREQGWWAGSKDLCAHINEELLLRHLW